MTEMPLPHQPIWNLLPRSGRPSGGSAWKCTWHGWVEDALCSECGREHAEWLETGNWEDRRKSPQATQ